MDVAGTKNSILVTGAHRSGTTWVGKMLSVPSSVGYVDEPFRPDQRPGIFNAGIDCWFAYWRDLDETVLAHEYRRLLNRNYSLRAELASVSAPRDVLRMIRDAGRTHLQRLTSERVLVKDPISALSSAWIADRFDAEVLVLVRHPAAFAYSLKRKGWTFPFSHLLAQPRLLEDHLEAFEGQIRAFAGTERPIVDQAALLWGIIYSVLSRYIRTQSDWLVVRHEDLALQPMNGFYTLYEKLGMDFTAEVREVINRHSSTDNPLDPSGGAKDVRRDSRNLVGRWRSGLDSHEVERVRQYTQRVASEWYEGNSWRRV